MAASAWSVLAIAAFGEKSGEEVEMERMARWCANVADRGATTPRKARVYWEETEDGKMRIEASIATAE